MKITKSKLKEIIKEEYNRAMREAKKLEEQAVMGADHEDTSDEPTVSTDATGEQWKRISAGDPALAKEVAELAWERGVGLKDHPHAVELSGRAGGRNTVGKLLGQQTGIKTDGLGAISSKDHFYAAALVWDDFITGAVVKQLYYLHKRHGPDLPYNVEPWDKELPNPKPMPSKHAGSSPDDPALQRVLNRPRTRW